MQDPRPPTAGSLQVRPLTDADRPAWELLARGYKDFYKTATSDAEYEQAWQRLRVGGTVHGLAACLDGQVVGLAHYLFHASAWAERVCYLQDLYTAPQARGHGVARALVTAVADAARQAGAARYYWLTQENNAVARVLYERVAQYRGFIRYDHPL